MSDKYILDGKKVVPVRDLNTWAEWFEKADRRVARSDIGRFWVSTVFLGLNHRFGPGEPLLFETMVFEDGDMSELWGDRCSTWDEAEAMHERGCAFAREKLN